MINSKKLKDRMKQRSVTQNDLSGILGIAKPTVSQKLNGVRPMFLDEAEKISRALEISDEEFASYFFD